MTMNVDTFWQLDEIAMEVLFRLPAEPCGMSASELADGILLSRSQASIKRISEALATIRRRIGLIDERFEMDEFGKTHQLYGLPRSQILHVRRFAACLARNPQGPCVQKACQL